jgi:hypothetical protein
MKKIQLTKGQFALVDEKDFEDLSKYKWCASQKRGSYYAIRGTEIGYRKRTIPMHRQILQLENSRECDHINGDTLDNRRENLRECSHAENLANSRKQRGGNSSRFKGVYWAKQIQRWRAQIRWHGHKRSLGCYLNEQDAALAYNEAAEKLFGDFARLNKIVR